MMEQHAFVGTGRPVVSFNGMALGEFGMDMAQKAPDALQRKSILGNNSLARTGGWYSRCFELSVRPGR